jgi:hypothetical protein
MIKQCRHCGCDFEIDESNQYQRKREYCSGLCGNRERDKRKKSGPVRIEKICEECGITYIAKRFDSVTCGPKCYEERNRRRVKEAGAAYREKYRAERLLKKEMAKQKKEKIESIDQVQAKAQAMGMSYGRYLAYMQIQKGAYK